MKKIRLNAANLEATEILSRDQLKSILGGDGSGYSGQSCGTSAILCVNNSTCTTGLGTPGTCGITEINRLLYCACIEN